MSDVDAVRLLASEYNLEFVDLERYNVDPSAAAVVPAPVARKHNVVPIGRKFGAPVIAISNPGDVVAMDTLRATIGREFISVVAVGDQIDSCLERVYGSGSSSQGPTLASTMAVSAPNVATLVADPFAPQVPDADAAHDDDPLSAALDDALGLVSFSTAVPAAAPPDVAPPEPVVPVTTAEVVSVEAEPAVDATRLDPPQGVEAPPSDDTDQPVVDHSPVRATDPVAPVEEAGAGSDAASVASETTLLEDPLSGDVTVPVTANDEATPGDPGPDVVAEPVGADPGPNEAPTTADAGGVDADSLLEALTAEPDSPAAAGSNGSSSDLTFSGADLVAAELGLADAADTLGDPLAVLEGAAEVVDDVAAAADLVEGAVAEYEQSGGETPPSEASGELAGFPPLGRVLVEGGRVPLEAMRRALAEHDRTGQSIARVLTAQGLVSEADLMWGMAEEMGLRFVDLDVQGIDFAACFDLPESTARHHNVLVVGREDGVPVVAASNPTDVFAMDDLRTIIGRNFITVVATRSQINAFIEQAYNQGGDASAVANTAADDFGGDFGGGDELENISAVVDDAPIVRYVNLLILQALNERASDIHVEPTADQLRIRYRIDGVLHDMSTAPRSIGPAVTTRLKVMADMNIAEHRIPQDGRISLNVGNRGIDLRMATLPTIYGEKIVMRVLDKSNVVLGFEDLGFDSDLLEIYETIYSKPYGTILVTGPTGSGKTTTLYATLAALNSPEKNIITVEDPVELRIKGINQVQLNLKAGLTFASALKSILRSDPDIVLVGEIRDRETALISVEASLTGHLVLATLHTNDAASTPMRLVEMGLEPYLVTSAVSAAVAQRLARRLCPHCREPYEPTEAEIVASGWRVDEVFTDGKPPTLYRAVGCSACSNTGYRGRKALLELLVATEEVERMIIEGGTADDIHRLAVEQGMVTLRQSGLRKAVEGETTLEEVLRVVA
jgi:type IV pilus assembly protein PilB